MIKGFYGLDKKEQVNAMNNPTHQLQDCVGEKISVKGWIFYTATRGNDDSENKNEEVDAVSIVDLDGNIYSTLSPTGISDFKSITEVAQEDIEKDGLMIEVVQGESNNKRKFIKINWV